MEGVSRIDSKNDYSKYQFGRDSTGNADQNTPGKGEPTGEINNLVGELDFSKLNK